MTLQKTVVGPDGPQIVEMTAEEEAATLAGWAANDPRTLPPTPKDDPNPIEKLKVFLTANPDVKALLGL